MDTNGHILRWPHRVLTGENLRTGLNGHREVVLRPDTVVTPLAHETLRHNGVRVTREATPEASTPGARWGYAQDGINPLVVSAVRAAERDGVRLHSLKAPAGELPCRWARAVAECVARGECHGGVLFCQDPGLVCCVANKVSGLRAIGVTTVAQAARAALTLGANLVAVEMPGRTYFEIRQILRTVCLPTSTCPPGVACTLQELDGHAHR